MGCTVRIGNVEGEFGEREEDAPLADVERVELPNAPAFENDYAERGNSRSPTYGVWIGFLAAVGLASTFGEPENGPGSRISGGLAFPLTRKDLAEVDAAVDRWRAQHPSATPRFRRYEDPRGDAREEAEWTANAHLGRLLWLQFWVRWALENCRRPGIQCG